MRHTGAVRARVGEWPVVPRRLRRRPVPTGVTFRVDRNRTGAAHGVCPVPARRTTDAADPERDPEWFVSTGSRSESTPSEPRSRGRAVAEAVNERDPADVVSRAPTPGRPRENAGRDGGELDWVARFVDGFRSQLPDRVIEPPPLRAELRRSAHRSCAPNRTQARD